MTSPTDRSGVLARLLAGALGALLSLTLALPLVACSTESASEPAGAEITDEAAEAEATPPDPAGTVTASATDEPEDEGTADGTSDEASAESSAEEGDDTAPDETDDDPRASGTILYTNDFFGFVAELPAEYGETEPDLVNDEGDTVVLSAGDAKGDACLILTHTLPTADEESGEDREPSKAGDASDTETDEDARDNGNASEASEDDADAAGDEESEDDADEVAETVLDPIDDWARTYAAWVIAALEDEGATITRSEIGRATLGGASCVIVEIEFEPKDGTSESEADATAQRDLFFFDGRSDTSSVGLCVDCLALSKEALDTLEGTFVAK